MESTLLWIAILMALGSISTAYVLYRRLSGKGPKK